jgi:[lysine-biosynthesis-protein LysW]---L-2-aminoadipate ligase
LIHQILRKEELLLLESFKKNNVEIQKLDDRTFHNDMSLNVNLALQRSLSYNSGLMVSKLIEFQDIPVYNSSKTADICGNKITTSLLLRKNNVKQPDFYVAFSEETVLELLEKVSYPIVMKPPVGSWGRLISKINDKEAAETVLEHKKVLGNYTHHVYYLQEYINKPGRDIRSFVVGDECIAAIYRYSNHWITNTARGGRAENCPVTDEIREMSLKAAKAVEGKIIACDLFEDIDGSLMINEVNHTMEFKNSIQTTGVNIPDKIVEFLIEEAKR